MKHIPKESPQLIVLQESLEAGVAAMERIAVAALACRKEHGWIPTMAATGLSRNSLGRWCNGFLYKSNRLVEVLESVSYHRR